MSQRFSHLVIVLPCHSLEDFPTHHRGADADNLLAYWTALWHPALLATAQVLPQIQPAEFSEPQWLAGGSYFDHDCDFESSIVAEPEPDESQKPQESTTDERTDRPLVVIPRLAQPLVDSQFLMEIQQCGHMLEELESREDLVAAALEHCSSAAKMAQSTDAKLAEDFFALGYAYLQVQLMTRQLRYSSNLDEPEFQRRVIQAAQSAVEGQTEAAHDQLIACYDLLLEEKNAYYPVEPQLCDVVLTAPSTLGNRLAQELDGQDHPLNLLITGADAEQLAKNRPETVATIRQRIDDRTLTLVGGFQQELPEWLSSAETTLHQLQLGCDTLARSLGAKPRVFLRRKFGLHPTLPGLLNQLDYLGAIHATMDGGTFPRSANGVIRWNGEDGNSILALGDVPLDASDGGSFLGLGVKLGEMIDSAHMASAVFMHWPDQHCQAFEDLKRITRYSPLFGDFIGLDDFFESVYDPGYGDTYTADEYRTPYFKQAIGQHQVDPISRCTRHWRGISQIRSIRNLAAQALARHDRVPSRQTLEVLEQQLLDLQSQLEAAIEIQPNGMEQEQWANINANLNCLQQMVVHWWQAGELVVDMHDAGAGQDVADRGSTDSGPDHVPWSGPQAVKLVNPLSGKRRVVIRHEQAGQAGSLKNQPPVLLADQQQAQGTWIVDLPGSGCVTLHDSLLQDSNLLSREPALAEELRIQNEFLLANFDRQTGGIRSVNFHAQRLNLMSQQLAVRIPSGSSDSGGRRPARYSTMKADQVEIVAQTRLRTAMKSTGSLMDGDRELARFSQTVHLSRGIARLEFNVELEMLCELQPSINHYVCSRLAWKEEAASIYANALDSRQPVTSEWFHATNFVAVGDEHTVTLLTGGLPFHRRSNRRMLDSLLVCHGESLRRFQFAIDIDQRYGAAAAMGRMIPPLIVADGNDQPAAGSTPSGSEWWFHLDAKNVQMVWVAPFIDESGQAGLRIRLRETEGRSATTRLRSRRQLGSVEVTDFRGQSVESLAVERERIDAVKLELAPFGYQQLTLKFK